MLAITLSADWEPREGALLTSDELAGRFAGDARQAWRNPHFELGQRPMPRITAPDDVIVKVHRAGIARSNCKMGDSDAEGYVLLPYMMRLPLIPGHEIAGEIVETGPAVRHLQVGDPVAVQALQPCGSCRACLLGRPNQCLDTGFSGLTSDGGMAQYFVTAARFAHSLVPVAERAGFDRAMDVGAVCEPAAMAYVGMFRQTGGFLPGETVAVFGCGPIGLSCVSLARCAGAAKIIAFDRTPKRLRHALALGADMAVDIRELADHENGISDVLLNFSGGVGIDFFVEATGDARGLFPQFEKALAIGAKVVSLGVERKPMPISLFAYQGAGAWLTGTMGHIGGFEPLIALHASARIDLSAIIDARFDLSEGLQALRVASRFEEAKVVLLPHAEPAGGTVSGGAV
ncbi:alcohol dehydrogenase catalytic domain-containing protein [Niveispirillum fermenti]|uniref:alcohol dehydrogenase catalytic domain-containing protein n=1 Tax=Niveispirillum fermenti TaxID=1233113 RepID=UPI003A846BCC